MKRLGLRLHADEEHWIPLSDLMTGLMFLFLLIALAYMVEVEIQHARAKDVALLYTQARTNLYNDLDREFNDDLSKWGADLDRNTLSIRFYGPGALFATGSSELQPRFKTILDDFFPRYLRILTQRKYVNLISEVRIEGYTSTSWKPGASLNESYIGNMALSQDRTRSVLGYALDMPAVQPEKPWLIQVLTANGLSFSHLRTKADGTEDAFASQRVEFRVRTNADEQIRKVLDLSR
jgi:outer membrane protein OmpA-like peptidoglycan-associated protein